MLKKSLNNNKFRKATSNIHYEFSHRYSVLQNSSFFYKKEEEEATKF
jgi:hypothetical protein